MVRMSEPYRSLERLKIEGGEAKFQLDDYLSQKVRATSMLHTQCVVVTRYGLFENSMCIYIYFFR